MQSIYHYYTTITNECIEELIDIYEEDIDDCDCIPKDVGYGPKCKLFVFKYEPQDNNNIAENNIARISEILVGFYSKEDVSFDVYIGKIKWCTHNLKANNFSYALKDTIIPITSIPYASIFINSTKPLYLVYSYIHPSALKYLGVKNVHYFVNNTHYYYIAESNNFDRGITGSTTKYSEIPLSEIEFLELPHLK